MTLPSEAIAASAAKAVSQSTTNTGLILGLVVPLVVVILGFIIRNRKLTIDYNSGLRSEFITEMHNLRDEIKGLRGENEGLRTEVKTMRRENDLLRDEVRQLHGVIDGLRRQSLQTTISAQGDVLRTFPPSAVPAQTLKAMERLESNGVVDALIDDIKSRSIVGEGA
jgi:cell division protein FtsB